MGLYEQVRLKPDPLLPVVGGIEGYPRILGLAFIVTLQTSTASWYWDNQLKIDGVYDKRFAQPFFG